MVEKVKEGQDQYKNPVMATWTGISSLFKKRVPAGELTAAERLDGKKVLITGASSGLGFATAVRLAKRGATVIMACRSGIPEKGEEVKRKSGSGDVFMLKLDLTDLDQVKSFVENLKKEFGEIDILVSNAAVVAKSARKTKHGTEEMFTVNYLAKFYLVNEILRQGILKKKDDNNSRIIFVSSESHRDPAGFDWDTFGQFNEHKIGETVKFYGYYKMLLTTFTRELSRRLNPDGEPSIPVFALCPGPVNSNIAREAPAVFKPLLRLVFSIFFRSPQKASEPVEYFAATKAVNGMTYDYMFLMERKAIDSKSEDPANGSKLWEKTEQLLGELGY
jgi:NAD(P)-dependent dehydrogenase (short-subunit alcohol dehydrogenase family)